MKVIIVELRREHGKHVVTLVWSKGDSQREFKHASRFAKRQSGLTGWTVSIVDIK